MNESAVVPMIDLAFALEGDSLPRDHRHALAAALEERLPWLAATPGAGMHRLAVSGGGEGRALLSRRTRLILRVPLAREDDARSLEGVVIDIGADRLRLGTAQRRELLPWGTLYAHLVAVDDPAPGQAGGELDFLQAVDSALQSLGVQGRSICGRHQSLEADTVQGYSLMIDGLSAAGSVRLQQAGIGAHRRLGCGLFIPHKSAAAVGMPP